MITIISAFSKNFVIGNNNSLIWHIPEDLKRFKNLTSKGVVLMGRKTYQSIGKPLINRTNIVISKSQPSIEGCFVYDDWKIPLYKYENIFVIGGQTIYEQLLPFTDKLELTIIDKEFEGDSFFPKINFNDWNEVYSEEKIYKSIKYKFLTLEK